MKEWGSLVFMFMDNCSSFIQNNLYWCVLFQWCHIHTLLVFAELFKRTGPVYLPTWPFWKTFCVALCSNRKRKWNLLLFTFFVFFFPMPGPSSWCAPNVARSRAAATSSAVEWRKRRGHRFLKRTLSDGLIAIWRLFFKRLIAVFLSCMSSVVFVGFCCCFTFWHETNLGFRCPSLKTSLVQDRHRYMETAEVRKLCCSGIFGLVLWYLLFLLSLHLDGSQIVHFNN